MTTRTTIQQKSTHPTGADIARSAPAIANAFGTTFWVAVALTVAAFIPAALLPRRTPLPKGRDTMTERRFIKPSWGQRREAVPDAPLFQRDLISKLSVPGRKTGRWHTTPVAVLDHDGERYLISYRGASGWALNLEASHHGRLAQRGRVRGDQGRRGSGRAAGAAARGLRRALRRDADRRRRAARATRSRRPPDVPDRLVRGWWVR